MEIAPDQPGPDEHGSYERDSYDPRPDTIFALASGSGRAAIAVMRISGPRSGFLLDRLCGRRPPPRRAVLKALYDPRDDQGEHQGRAVEAELLDHGLVLWLPGPNSYTGEDSAELHLHAGPAVIAAVANALVDLGARPAEPGEFTQRAFLNGRMDLLEAEAIGDLVAAETSGQRRQALRQLEGALGSLYEHWTTRLRELLAQQEAVIEFPDEALPPDIEDQLRDGIVGLLAEVRLHLDDGRRGEKLREGLVFAVTGAPNVGKSSLVNALAARDVAIVSATPGTTRDLLEASVVLGGVPVTLVDTAGLRPSDDPIEAEGIRRARARADDADLVLIVIEAGAGVSPERPCSGLLVANKADLVASDGLGAASVGPDAILVSARTGCGLETLRQALATQARALTDAGGPPPLTRARHRAALSEVTERLHAALSAELPELRSEDLRLALRAIGRITGAVGVDEILGTIFSQFCIGK